MSLFDNIMILYYKISKKVLGMNIFAGTQITYVRVDLLGCGWHESNVDVVVEVEGLEVALGTASDFTGPVQLEDTVLVPSKAKYIF